MRLERQHAHTFFRQFQKPLGNRYGCFSSHDFWCNFHVDWIGLDENKFQKEFAAVKLVSSRKVSLPGLRARPGTLHFKKLCLEQSLLKRYWKMCYFFFIIQNTNEKGQLFLAENFCLQFVSTSMVSQRTRTVQGNWEILQKSIARHWPNTSTANNYWRTFVTNRSSKYLPPITGGNAR